MNTAATQHGFRGYKALKIHGHVLPYTRLETRSVYSVEMERLETGRARRGRSPREVRRQNVMVISAKLLTLQNAPPVSPMTDSIYPSSHTADDLLPTSLSITLFAMDTPTRDRRESNRPSVPGARYHDQARGFASPPLSPSSSSCSEPQNDTDRQTVSRKYLKKKLNHRKDERRVRDRGISKDFMDFSDKLDNYFQNLVELVKSQSRLLENQCKSQHELKSEILDVKGKILDVKGEMLGVKGEMLDLKGEMLDVKSKLRQIECKNNISQARNDNAQLTRLPSRLMPVSKYDTGLMQELYPPLPLKTLGDYFMLQHESKGIHDPGIVQSVPDC